MRAQEAIFFFVAWERAVVVDELVQAIEGMERGIMKEW